MTRKQTRRLLIVAFAISLLVHAIVALKIDWPFALQKEDVQIVRIVKMHTLRVSKLPTPPPHTPPPATPAPTPSTAATPARKSLKLPSLRPGSSGPSSSGGATPVPTRVPPTPQASPTPNCAQTDTPVTLVAKPEQPDIAAAARAAGTSGVAKVLVHVEATGAVTQAALTQSSGNSSLDLVVVGMARGAHYAPATHACKAVASDYTFSVKFVAQ